MYKGLVRRLRKTSMDFGELDTVSVLLLEAANAIEELSKKRDAACWGCKCNKIERNEWIPVTERLPELGEIVIVYTKEPILTRGIWLDRMVISSKNKTPYWANHNGRVLYWMPRPQPPRGEI